MNPAKTTFQHGNREVTATIVGTEVWEKAGMSRVYINLAFEGAKLPPIDKLYEVLAGGTKDATIEVHGRTFGYQLGISCDSKTKRAAAVQAITELLTAFVAPVHAASTETDEGSYISWGLQADDLYDSEGDIIGQDEYVLIEKLYVAPVSRRKGKGRAMLRQALKEIAAKHPGMSIKVAALPFDGEAIEMDALVAFYESEGFSVEDANCNCHAVIMKL